MNFRSIDNYEGTSPYANWAPATKIEVSHKRESVGPDLSKLTDAQLQEYLARAEENTRLLETAASGEGVIDAEFESSEDDQE